jgi:hypothetical protein
MSRALEASACATVFLLLVMPSGCEPRMVSAVDPAVGVYRPGGECAVLEAGGASCPTGAQIAFDHEGDTRGFEASAPLGNLRVSCRRPYCGTGALAVSGAYRWRDPRVQPPASERLGEIRYQLPEPVDLLGKTIAFDVFVDGPRTPFNIQLAIDTGPFRSVHDGVFSSWGGWTRWAGLVDPSTLRPSPGAVTTLPVTAIIIQLYLATEVRTGDLEHWNPEIYIDELGWN